MLEGGLNVWVVLLCKVNIGMKSCFFRKVFDSNVLYVLGGFCYIDDPMWSKLSYEMCLSFGVVTEVDIQKGICCFGQVI